MNRKAVGLVSAFIVIQAVAVLAFLVPARDPSPHGVRIAVTGPAAGAASTQQRLDKASPGGFAVRGYADERSATAAIRDRDVYGALVVTPSGAARLLVASAASPTIAQLLEQGPGAQAASTRDVVPLDSDDARGVVINALFLPLIIGSLPAAAALVLVGSRGRGLLGALGAIAGLGGVVVMAIVALGLGALPGPFLALAGIAALIISAMAFPAAGLIRMFGTVGVAPVVVLFLLIGNPGSGNATGREMLPGFWRAVGPLLPPGAGGTLLRHTAYFDGAAVAGPIVVLTAFAAGGAALVLLADRRHQAA